MDCDLESQEDSMQIIFPETSAGVQIFALGSALITAGVLFLFLRRAAGEAGQRTLLLVAGVCLSVNADSCGSEMTQKVNDKPTCSRCLIFKHRVATRMGYGFEPLLPRTSTHLSTKIVDGAMRCFFLGEELSIRSSALPAGT